MTVSLFTFVDLYRRHVVTADHLLTKGSAFAAASGIGEAEMLGWRLHDDMHPLGFQLMVVANFARSWPARVADVPVPEAITADRDAAGFHTAFADALAFLATLTPEQFAGRDDVPLTVQLTDTITPSLPAGHWLSVFATTNIAFHLSTAYGILRMKGVPLGKLDLFAAGL
ncbi:MULTISPECIES: DUF1993 family protein [Sphingomonas]|uniref:DUF1993 family protein n=1 Tax=Sphingomonas TaxID=13687 RepID=UPI00082B3EA4|nr:DUF1993 family protein [Sphingomonas sp. CCH10-B3]